MKIELFANNRLNGWKSQSQLTESKLAVMAISLSKQNNSNK